MADTKAGGTLGGRIDNLEQSTKRVENYVIGIAIVSSISVITLLMTGYALFMDSNRFKSDTYQVLVDKIDTLVDQNKQKDLDIRDQKILELERQIIEIKNPH